MSRSGSGAYSVPNTFVEETEISPDEVNQNFDDIGSEIANSLALDGQSSMTGQIKAASGSSAAPGYSFANELGSGWYRAGAGDFRYAVGGADVFKITSAGVEVIGTFTGAATIADGAVTTAKLADLNVTLAKLAAAAFASQAEAEAGTESTKLVTSLRVSQRIAALALAPLASPTFTGAPAAPTPTTGDSTTKLATTAFVQAQIAATGGGTTYGAIGTYVFGTPSNSGLSGGVNAGSTINAAVNNLSPTNAQAGATGVGLITSGIWRCMGFYSADTVPTLWVRVS